MAVEKMNMSDAWRFIDLQTHGDSRGLLTVAEYLNPVPFRIERVYILHDTKQGESRGFHAHKTLEQILFVVSGSLVITLDDGHSRERMVIQDSRRALYIRPGVWREMSDFSPGAVCIVLASALYDETDYIRDYHAFLEWKK
jgi:dTDP-4-dehydrorhamnose 3,5-epimerase-like enzyme